MVHWSHFRKWTFHRHQWFLEYIDTFRHERNSDWSVVFQHLLHYQHKWWILFRAIFQLALQYCWTVWVHSPTLPDSLDNTHCHNQIQMIGGNFENLPCTRNRQAIPTNGMYGKSPRIFHDNFSNIQCFHAQTVDTITIIDRSRLVNVISPKKKNQFCICIFDE